MFCLNLICIILLLLSGSTPENVESRDLREDAQRSLQELRAIVDAATIKAQTQLSTIRGTFVGLKDGLFVNATDHVNQAHELLMNQLDNLEDLADFLHRSDCMSTQKQTLSLMREEISESLDRCLVSVEREATTTIINITVLITETQLTVDSLQEKLEACPGGEGSIECLTVVLEELDMAKTQLPKATSDQVLKALLMTDEWKRGLWICYDYAVGQMYTKGNTMISELERCLITSRF